MCCSLHVRRRLSQGSGHESMELDCAKNVTHSPSVQINPARCPSRVDAEVADNLRWDYDEQLGGRGGGGVPDQHAPYFLLAPMYSSGQKKR